MAASRSPCASTIAITSRRVAPSAMRTPISTVRRDTEYATTPYRPMAPSASPSAARLASAVVLKRGSATASDTMPFTVPMS